MLYSVHYTVKACTSGLQGYVWDMAADIASSSCRMLLLDSSNTARDVLGVGVTAAAAAAPARIWLDYQRFRTMN